MIPDTAGEKPTEGRVVAVGHGKVLDNGKVRSMDPKVGDRVLCSENMAVPRSSSAGEEDVMAVFEDGTTRMA